MIDVGPEHVMHPFRRLDEAKCKSGFLVTAVYTHHSGLAGNPAVIGEPEFERQYCFSRNNVDKGGIAGQLHAGLRDIFDMDVLQSSAGVAQADITICFVDAMAA